MPLKKFRFQVPKFSPSSAKAFLSYAFGLSEKPGPYAVLEVGSTTLRSIECIREDGSLRLLSYHVKEVSPQNLALPTQEAILQKELKTFLTEAHLTARRVILGFSSGLVLVRKITIPEMPKEELPKALRWAVRAQLPFDAEHAALAFEGNPPKDKKQEVFLAVAEEASLVNWITLIQESGLKVIEVALAPLGLLQWLRENKVFQTETVALLDIGTFHTTLFILAAGKILFVREFPMGGETVTQAMMQVLSTEKGRIQLTPDEAERLKRSSGFPSEEVTGEKLSRTQLVSLIRPVLERLGCELQRSLEYCHQESGLSVKKLVLIGGGSRLKQLDRFLQEKLVLPVEALSLSLNAFFSAGPLQEEVFKRDLPVLATTLALAARQASSPFNLLPVQFRERKSEKVERAAVRMASFALSIFLLTLFFFKGTQGRVLEKESQVLQMQEQKVQELETLQRKIEEAKTLSHALVKDHPFFNGALKELSQSLPSNAVLDRLDYDTTTKSFLLSGTLFAAEGHPAEGSLGDLISRLEKSFFFKGVRLISSERDATYSQQASNFQIQCELVMP